jgi:hypothetical protein
MCNGIGLIRIRGHSEDLNKPLKVEDGDDEKDWHNDVGGAYKDEKETNTDP